MLLDGFFAICKAMLQTGITPDFVTVDGAEGGTGAAPIEFTNHVGMPLREGLVLVQNALVGVGLRDRIRIAASGKQVTASAIAASMALGADWCNSARGFMFAVGCIQAQACHTNECPVGVATQNPRLQRGLVVPDKAERVANFHRNTVEALAEIVSAAGLNHPAQLTPSHVYLRTNDLDVHPLDHVYTLCGPGDLLENRGGRLQPAWDRADANRFHTPIDDRSSASEPLS